ncbi:MAG: NTP transferase domain-containing protein [Candidatus Rokubacteria bacterium]|nr:NTP transferase domain-containing protein [Candidatus Rokubacteria bacterium]
MSPARALRGGIIAAGDGTRLRRAGYTMPKPLVPVAGVPLIESVIRNFAAAGITSLVIIVNEQARACVSWVRSRFPELDAEFVVKTTRSSLESFREVSQRLAAGRAPISTVDAWCRPADFAGFVDAALRRPPDATVLAVTPLVADETPLWVDVDDAGRVTRLGRESGTMVTAGVYMMSMRARALVPPAGLGRLREFLAWLVQQGEPLYAEVIDTVVDVDRAADVALAETLALGERKGR